MITLRIAKEDDLSMISDLAEQIWPHTYGAYLSQEQLRYMLDLMYNHGELLSQLQKGHTFIIAHQGEKDLGFAGFSCIESEKNGYKLHKIYVLPETQGQGVGKLLMNEVVDLVGRNGGKTLQLNVNRNNKARYFYEKAGFIIKETVDIDLGNGFFMNDYVMERTL